MPYIVTTTTPEKPYLTASIAAATLEEARQRVFERTERYGCVIAVDAARSIREVGHPDPHRAGDASGGTVGPLPDGTVIEVERVTRTEVLDRLGQNAYLGMTGGTL